MPVSRARARALLALTAGAIWGACWLPWLPGWLFPVPFVVLLLAFDRVDTGRQAVATGVLYAVAAYGVSGHFLFALTRFAPGAAVFFFLMVGYFVPFLAATLWAAWRVERATGLPRSVAFVPLYGILESARTWTDLSFPADVLAHGMGDGPAWLAWAPAIGSHGITLWLVAVASLVHAGLRAEVPRIRGGLVAGALVLWLAAPATAPLLRPEPGAGPPLRAGIVQPAVALTEKFDPSRHEDIWRRLVSGSRAVAGDVDLVVWPESARPLAVRWDDDGPFVDPMMEDLARRLGVPVLYGTEIARYRDGRLRALYNGAAVAYPDGRPGDWYGKQRLLPLAEGVPFAEAFGYDPFAGAAAEGGSGGVLRGVGKFSPGPRPTLFEIAGARIGVLICYEGMYPKIAARYRAAGADALAVLTNDLWWGATAFPRWHANQAASVARTLELPVLRAANAGISGGYGPDGAAHGETALFDVTAAVVELPRASPVAPPSAAVAAWTPAVAAVALAALALAARSSSRRRGR